MGEIVNLHRAVKRRARAAETAAAAENRVRHGRGGAQIARDEQAASRRTALLDGASIEPTSATSSSLAHFTARLDLLPDCYIAPHWRCQEILHV